jgi:hypothetical protein
MVHDFRLGRFPEEKLDIGIFYFRHQRLNDPLVLVTVTQ